MLGDIWHGLPIQSCNVHRGPALWLQARGPLFVSGFVGIFRPTVLLGLLPFTRIAPRLPDLDMDVFMACQQQRDSVTRASTQDMCDAFHMAPVVAGRDAVGRVRFGIYHLFGVFRLVG